MIRSTGLETGMEEGIPRESGDDPTMLDAQNFAWAYSPRERG